MLKSTWLRNEKSLSKTRSNVVQFMLSMREKLAVCQDLALKAAQHAQTKEKLWYDRASRDRTFEIGQRVLVLLPMQGKPLEPKYQGPFTIIDKVLWIMLLQRLQSVVLNVCAMLTCSSLTLKGMSTQLCYRRIYSLWVESKLNCST